ncbi:MAG: alcohol dehydrogenase catalytic domain-containing protein, partial [Planctomycetes bacterium]|nr:alcohol dehydrogenase catalytic domain-containing protein [Planctomycetota bacterium]
MGTVRAAVMVGPGKPIEVREFPEPDLEVGAALLSTTYSEVCGTDVHLWRGRLADAPFPIIPGHINVGVLEEISGQILDVEETPFQEGDLVTFLDVHETCGRCWYCLVAKATTRCPHRKVYGITYSAVDGLLGGWSEKIYLKPGVKLLRLPEDVSAEAFIAGGCALPTALHAIERAAIVPG